MTRSSKPYRTSALRQAVGLHFSPLILLFLFTTRFVHAEELILPLTNASQVLSLPAEEAIQGRSIRVTGVVTAAQQNWDGRFFVQDSSAGVFVENLTSPPPQPGDKVEVTGVSHPGAFAPIITKPQWRKLGTAPMPKAKVVPIEQLMAGIEDGQRVEVVGIVRDAAFDGTEIRIMIASGGYRLRAYLPPGTYLDLRPDALVGSRVRVRGTAAATFNAELRHLISMILYVPVAEDFKVEQFERADPFAEPLLSLENIAQYRWNATVEQRVHVKGTVTYQRPGQDIFLKDTTGGLHVRSSQLDEFADGDVIEAVGFPGLENHLPVLQDATVRKTSEPPQPVVADPVSIAKLQAGLHHADFVAIEGTLLERTLRPVRQARTGKMWVQTVLLMQSSNLTFTAEAETPAADPNLESIRIGSRIEVRGVCLTDTGDDGKFKSLQVLLENPRSFRILSEPSWLTPQRLGIALGILGVVSIVAVSWIIMIWRKNSELNVQIREKEHAQAELQDAHDQLEVRVKERTEQLKIQIAARKESELQFKGVLAERTRLAQELHDTLEQMLTSIALQLDTCAKLSRKDTEAANYHLELGRNILAQSQIDLRRSVWDLRSRALEQFSLRSALATSSKQITDDAGVKLDIQTTGAIRPLPEIVEENLLRITQEALTNIIKHAHADRAEIKLHYSEQSVSLQISDNGRGFLASDCAGARDGHFGLLGISERVQRLRGNLKIESEPGLGTSIQIVITTEPAPGVQRSEAVDLNPA